ncbi:MAG TPA: hypothetical protein VEX15_19575, partial [Nocardioidaceae bacterium]|nr:hypothetical protein [Nocardioidaceae bacterium]
CSRRPYSGTPIYDIDHIDRHTDGGPTTAGNGQGLGVGDHHTLDLPDWHVTTTHAGHQATWTTPTGHTHTSTPPPILGHGNTPRRRPPRPPPRIEIYTHPINAQCTITHHRPQRQ